MLSTPRLRVLPSFAVFASIAVHAVIGVAAAGHGVGSPASLQEPAEVQVEMESPPAPLSSDPIVDDRDRAPPSPSVEHRQVGSPHTVAAAPRVLAAQPSSRPSFALVLGSSEASSGLASAVGKGDGLGKRGVPGQGSDDVPRPDTDAIVPDSAVSQHARMPGTTKPVYPPAALAQGTEGSVTLEIVVDRHGEVIEARIVRSAGHGFDEAALRYLRSAPLIPALRDGHPVRVRMPWVVDFRID